MTRMIVHDTIALFRPLFTSRDRPKALFSRGKKGWTGLFGKGG